VLSATDGLDVGASRRPVANSISVNAVSPGPIFTTFHLRRNSVLALSDDASYVTGALLFVDAGMTAL
jgi:hypothetical protein